MNKAHCKPPLPDAEVKQIVAGKAGITPEVEEEEAPQRNSQASEVVRFVLERCDMAHDENSDAYTIDRKTREVRHIGWRSFRTWVYAEFYGETQKSIRSQSYSEAVETLAGIGRYKHGLIEVHIRCASVASGYVIDMAEPGNSRAIQVQAGEWRIVNDPGVLFIRPESLKPLPDPVRGGDVSELWTLVNIPQDAQLLVLTWLLDSWRPDTPFPVLELIGEQGTAKSMTQSLLRGLIDPNTAELRSAPKNSEDVFVGASSNWLLAYDNITHLTPDLQDTFCRIATGATYATRRLYTNGEEFTLRAQRPVSINGISAAITAQDLVDRTVSTELLGIENRRERGAIEREFEDGHGRILGGLLDLFAAALAKLPAIDIPTHRRPRLIEYAQLGCAVASALGRDAQVFLERYEGMRAEAIARTIEACPVAGALAEYLEDRPDRYREYTMSELYGLLRPSTRPGEGWPRSPKGLADALRRAAPALRSMGIGIGRPRKRNGRLVTPIRGISMGPSTQRTQSTPDGHDQGTWGTSGTSSERYSPGIGTDANPDEERF